MKFIFMVSSFLFLCSFHVSAETEEEAMARIQQQLNSQIFGGNKTEPAPVIKAPPVKHVPAPQSTPEPVQAEALPVLLFTNYKLASLNVGMSKSSVFDVLKGEGYNCNIQEAKQMQTMLGRTVCIYASMASPKIIMMTFKNDSLKDFEMTENYKTGFPEEFFSREKSKFMKKYGNDARCKTQRRGETCEVFGHGYRIMLSSKLKSDSASIIHSFSTM